MQSRLELVIDSTTGERRLKSLNYQLGATERAGNLAAKSVKLVAGGVAALSAAAAGGLSFTRLIRETAGFEDSMLGLQAVSGATAAQMQELEKQARTLGATSMFSAQQAGDAQRFLAMAGFEVNEVLSATPGILQLATAGNLDLARAADIASNVLGGLRLEVDQLGRVNDVLAATAAGANTSIEQLGQALSFAAPFAASAGISLEETAAAIGTLSDSGLQASRAGTGLVGVIRQLSRVTPNARATLAKYGLTVDDVNIEAHGLTTVLDRLGAAGISTGDAFEIFGSEAGAAAQILANGSGRVRDFTGELNDAEGAAQRAAQIIGSGLTGSMRSFSSMLSESVINLGRDQGVAGGLQSVLDGASGVLAVYNDLLPEFAEANDLTDEQANNLNLVASALKGTAAAGAGIATVYLGVRGAIIAATIAQWGFNAAIRANPLMLAASAVVGLGSALYSLREELGLTGGESYQTSLDVDGLADAFNGLTKAQLENKRASLVSDLTDMRVEAGRLGTEISQVSRLIRNSGQLTPEGGAMPIATADDIAKGRELREELGGLLANIAGGTELLGEYEKLMQEVGGATGDTNTRTRTLAKAQRDAIRESERFANTLQSLQDQLFPVEAAQRKYREEQEVLNRAWNEGTISADRYTEAMRRLEQAQLSTQTPGSAYGGIGFGSQIGDPAGGMGATGEGDYWDRWLASAETALTDFDQLAANTAENFQRGFGNAFEAMVFDSQSLGEAMHNLTDGIARSMVNALGQMAGQWLAYQAVQLAVGKSSESAAIAGATVAGSSIAAAYAPAAAAASLATSGANSAPAMAGMASTYALSKTMALAGMAHDGIDSVPREGTWLLDKGERVVSSSLNRDLTQFLENDKQSDKQGVTITYAPVIQVEAAPGASMADAKRFGEGLDAYITTKFYRMVEKEKRPGGAFYRQRLIGR